MEVGGGGLILAVVCSQDWKLLRPIYLLCHHRNAWGECVYLKPQRAGNFRNPVPGKLRMTLNEQNN